MKEPQRIRGPGPSMVGAVVGALAGGAGGYPLGISMCESATSAEGALSSLCILAGFVGVPLGAIIGGYLGAALFPVGSGPETGA